MTIAVTLFCCSRRSTSFIQHVSAFSPKSTPQLTLGLNAFQMYYAEGKKNPSKLDFNHRTFSSTKSSSIMKASSSSSSLSSSVSNSEINEQETETTMKSLPESHPYISEIKPALSAIRKACRITSYLQPNTVNTNISGLNKKDASPVTIGDFAVQGLVLNMLEKEFENNIFIAEEGSKNLTPDDNDNGDDALSLEILDVMKECQFDSIIGNVNELKRSIDLGQTYEQNGEFKEEVIRNQKDMKGPIRTWCLDPIDGTRGFLRGKREGGQYCIALALIEDGRPVLGILGCPNLPVSSTDSNYAWSDDETPTNNIESRGCIIVASKDGGCYQFPMNTPEKDDDSSTKGYVQIKVTQNDGKGDVPLSQSRFCIGVETYSDPEGKISSIAEAIHGELDSDGQVLYSARMDSQVKYGVLARGGAEIYARLPKKEYVEWIWDHAPGRIVIEEAGGIQSDTEGNVINYGFGAKMDKDVDGIVASPGGVFHDALIHSLKQD